MSNKSIALTIIAILLAIIFWLGYGYIAIHFIVKYW